MKTKIQNLPQSYRLKSGKLGFLRGRFKGKNKSTIQLYAWDFVGDCILENCPVFRYCEKQPNADSENQKCQIQLEYVRQTANIILNCFDLDEALAFMVGTHLIPLYSDLVFLKITRAGLRSPVTAGARGGVLMHPVIKELRETHRRIVAMWSEIGLNYKVVAEEMGKIKPDLKKGDRTLYSRMMASKNREKKK